MEEKIVVILGPTATHKSDIALELVKDFPLEIVSADSMQFYKGMDIGTAKVSKEIREKIPHHFIDIIDVSQNYSVGQYKREFLKLVQEIYKNKKIPLIVGGSGLYIRAITENFPVEESPSPDIDLRRELEGKSLDEIKKLAESIDFDAASRVFDKKRLIRIIEYYKKTGKKISEVKNPSVKFRFLKIGLIKPREILYRDIEKRVDKMIELGFVEEVKSLKEKYAQWSKTARQAIGYKEILDYLEGQITFDEAIELIKKNTRHLAKRQITWFKKEKDVLWFDSTDIQLIINEIKRLVGDFVNDD
ncbi:MULTISPECIES: tRNA (adenosine(37)-N6)-dimethylallyltransferase MiaA [Caldisericum]|jgi:tRNA dimethylallyltransferase|uniref:tRNA dimethylallyltransferase n=1 Tax=Caldisericum exile TaxID=693075 RepID=A0A2J6WEW4_9BACT|nr:MAG: tRNA (adenosine(37)-N6)-dimethylallyltransferase MiaA [Caldisericum exile]